MTLIIFFLIQLARADECGSRLSTRFDDQIENLRQPFGILKLHHPVVHEPAIKADVHLTVRTEVTRPKLIVERLYHIVPIEGGFELQTEIVDHSPLDQLNVYAALRALPFVHRLRITETLERARLTLDDRLRFDAIREARRDGLSDKLSVEGHRPPLVEAFYRDVFPVEFLGVKIDGYVEAAHGQEIRVHPGTAETLQIDYLFDVP